MSKDAIQTVTSSVDEATDQDFRSVTGTDFGDKRVLDTISVPTGLAIGLNKFNGLSHVSLFGTNQNIGSSNTEVVWSVGNDWTPPTAAAAPSVVSTNANDTSAGTGARTIRVFGLDANFDLQEEDVSLDGLTPVVLPQTYTRVYKMMVLTAGTSAENEGDIDLTIGSDIQARIPTGRNKTLQAIFTIPNNMNGVMSNLNATVLRRPAALGAKEGHFNVFMRPDGGLFQHEQSYGLNSKGGPLDIDYPSLDTLAPKTDILVEFHPHSNSTFATAGFTIILEDIS